MKRPLLPLVVMVLGLSGAAWAQEGVQSDPAEAFTGTTTVIIPDEESANLPVGRLPDRTEVPKVVIPPFALTPPAELSEPPEALFRPEVFSLDNGLSVVVIPNQRAPIVSHMVWYRVGAADEPMGRSGLAHLLEHLMFKGTYTVPEGGFSRAVATHGGRDNAFTSWDYTAYFQNIAKDRLELMMKLEADRMANLTLTDAQVASEKSVVLDERRQTSETAPLDRLYEAMRATFFVHHPYGRPIIGWAGEIERLTREDVQAFYRTWYAPGNAIVVVSGDVTVDEVRTLASRTYGQVPARKVPARQRAAEPLIEAERRVVLRDAGVLQPVMMKGYLAPSYHRGKPEDVAALQVLTEVLGGGATSRLYRRLVMDLQVAASVRFDYDPVAYDVATTTLSIIPAPGQDIETAEAALAAVVADLLANGVGEAELARAKKRLLDSAVFARDSVQAPAYVFGMTLAAGGDVSDVEAWPRRVAAVTRDDVAKAAQRLFGQKGIVTGLLLPAPKEEVGEAAVTAPLRNGEAQ